MTSRERIKRTLEFKIADRVGIYDNLPVKTLEAWGEKDFDGFDLALFDLDKFDGSTSLTIKYKKAKDKDLFLTLSFSCPFQKAADVLGLENLLMMIARDPDAADKLFAKNAEHLIKSAEALKESGFIFDGAWMWSDMAYKNNTYFSPGTYKKLLYKYHVKVCGYFKKCAMPVILHCDGNCSSFMPLFLDAGVRALNPLEIDCGFSDAKFLKKEYGRNLVLFGNMPAAVLERDKKEIEEVFRKRLEILKAGNGFIYHSDKPISETVSLDNYRFALEIVKKYGKY